MGLSGTGPGAAGVHVAFFRDMNLGQARTHSPTSAQLRAAFRDSGAPDARNVRTNGTVIFASTRPGAVIGAVTRRLSDLVGYRGVAVLRTGRWVTGLARALDPDLPGGEVALFDTERSPRWDVPWVEPEKGHLTVLAIDGRHAITSWRGRQPGATPPGCSGSGSASRSPVAASPPSWTSPGGWTR